MELELGNPVVLGINTAFLYLFAAVFAGMLIFLFIRRRLRMTRLEQREGMDPFEKLPRADRQLELKRLLRRFPGLEESLLWLDSQLMTSLREPMVEVTVEQEWCCLDLTGQAQAPARCRPGGIVFSAGERRERRPIEGFGPEDFLTRDQNKLLCWGVMERCRTLIPFRVYRMRVRRITRRFRLGEEIPAGWQGDEAVMEEYTVEISR